MKGKHINPSRESTYGGPPASLEEFNRLTNSAINWDRFWNPDPATLTDQPLDYSTKATAFAIPIFEALHLMAGNPKMKLALDEPTETALPYEQHTMAECLKQLGAMCYTLHHLVEQATPNLDTDYHPHQTIAANSELLRELACLAFQIEPCFSEPEELEAAAGPLMPERLPHIIPITPEDFQNRGNTICCVKPTHAGK